MAEEIEINEKLRQVFKFVSAQTQILMDKFEIDGESEKNMKTLIENHLKLWYTFTDDGLLKSANIPIKFEFDELFEWVNTTTPRGDLNDLAASNLLIFDFFTHCCIDCIHSIEDLRQVDYYVKSMRKNDEDNEQEKFKCGFKIISIHSPKFHTEKKSESIQSSVQRMKMGHTEVLNDPHRVLWRQFGLHCWPTVMIFGPNVDENQPGPNLLFAFTLDNHRGFLKSISQVALEFFDARLTNEKVKKFRENLQTSQQESTVKVASQELKQTLSGNVAYLNFPGKITVYKDLVCISDTGNNRIIVADLNGNIQHEIGGSEDGYTDGDFLSARFYAPQGIAFENASLFYVADTGNHSIRKVNLELKTVSTIVPPGDPVLNLKSPWDLTFYSPGVLLIAGARTHQIFGYFFEEIELFGQSHSPNSVALVAGTGFEENRNHEDPLQASFSQPSGLVCTGTGKDRIVYIADSESSSIRCIAGGEVRPVVGASTDLYNLFAFGDQDGTGFDVKLQHPMDVSAQGESTLFLTDTYNHKIKKINLKTNECTNLIGDGLPRNNLGKFNIPGNKDDSGPLATFNEPAGICIDASEQYLFIADTNNHSIKVAHLEDDIVSEYILRTPQSLPESSRIDQEFIIAMSKSSEKVRLDLKINNVSNTFEGGNWKLFCPSLGGKVPIKTGELIKLNNGISVLADLKFFPWLQQAKIKCTIAYCEDSGCHLREYNFLFRFVPTAAEELPNGGAVEFNVEEGTFD